MSDEKKIQLPQFHLVKEDKTATPPSARRRGIMMLALWSGLVALSGCASADPSGEASPGEPVGVARQAQLDGGQLIWRRYEFVVDDGASTPLATVDIFNTRVGTYRPGREYWSINEAGVGLVGSYDLSITSTDSTDTNPPPDPGYSNEQESRFAQMANWGSGWASDPESGGSLYSGSNDTWLRLFTTGSTPHRITRIAWYQVLSGGSPANLSPEGAFSLSLASAVPVPSGDTGYDVSRRALY